MADKLCSEVKENRALEKELDELDDELDGKDRENRRSKRQVDRLRTQLARQAAQNRRQRILNLVLLVSIFLVLVFCVCVFPDATITLITRTNEMTQELRLTFVYSKWYLYFWMFTLILTGPHCFLTTFSCFLSLLSTRLF